VDDVSTLILIAGTAAAIQFLFCLPKKLFFKLIPVSVLIILWIAVMPTSGLNSPRFLMYLITQPVLAGMLVGWVIYLLLRECKRWIDKNKDKEE